MAGSFVGFSMSASYLNLSMFFAFASIWPDAQVLLFFIIPIRMKWLALVDALFKDGPVFLILDDPFVDLDDEHTSAAKSLLKKISKDRQIIYLVCNSSRNIR